MKKLFVKRIFMALGGMVVAACLLASVMLAVIKFNYPIAYTKEIILYSNEYNLDPNLVRAVIKKESKYNALAKSRKGALGLMQIMPITAKWIASELGEDFNSEDILFEPSVNIRYGCFYLRYLTNKFETLDKVLFAYNAGEGTLLKVLEADELLDVSKTNIVETRKYIEDVKKGYEIYGRLY